LQGSKAPSRAWKLTRKKDGSWARTSVATERIKVKNKAAFDRRELSQAREALGLSQSKFAHVLGVSVDTLQNWEQGRRKPTGAARVLLKIAAINPGVVMQAATA